ncbi:MAG: GAF domain-containing protein [Xenococcaceae cyanobacterium]
MDTDFKPEQNNKEKRKQVEQNELIGWNSLKLLEKLFNLEQVSQANNHTLKQSTIFTIAATEALKLLNCDRLIVYGASASSPGKVIAEAVKPIWNPLLGQVIEDPYLAPQYLASYQQGNYQAIDNINDLELEPEQIEPLQKLQIKAMSIVPIVQSRQLLGLFVAHQCSTTRQWRQAEINCLEQISTIVRLALERVQLIREKAEWQLQVEKEAEWTQFFLESISPIYRGQQTQDVLKTTVKEVRRIVNCDRVIVYGLNQARQEEIIAESIAPGWTKSFGKIISDPCFEARYLEKYRQGRVKAIDNIYTAKLTECYLEQLEQLEVKANLVAPILIKERVFGLLIAHQCSEPRQWKQYEIRWLSQVALQVGLVLDRDRVPTNSSQSGQIKSQLEWQKLLPELITYLRQSKSQSDLLNKTTKEARRILDCDRVIVYSLTKESYAQVIAESIAPGWTKAVGVIMEDFCQESQDRQQYELGLVRANNQIDPAKLSETQLKQLTQLQVKASLVVPLLVEGKLFGLLVAHYCGESHNWELAEIDFSKELASQVGLELERTQIIAERDLLKERSQTEVEWTEFFIQAVQYIHQSITKKDILETAVEEVRRVLECDRVLLYGLNQDAYGEVIAESVAIGWTKTLGRVINDPCFETKYLEQYQNGRVRAIDNIYNAELAPCYLEQLEELEVKANLVTPILNEGKIFGLLVAHQCSHPREWKQYEIRWVTQISTQVGFALDNARLLRQLEQSSQAADYIFSQHERQKAAFKQQLIALLSNSTNIYENLTQSTLSESEGLLDVLKQIDKISDIVKNQDVNFERAKQQKYQQNLKLRAINQSINLTSNNIANLQEFVREASDQMNHLSYSSQGMIDTIQLIQNLVKQIVQQSLNITIAIGRLESGQQESMIKLTDKLLLDAQELYKASAQINPLLSVIDTKVDRSKIAMDSAIERAIESTELVQDSKVKLRQIMPLNAEVDRILQQFTQASQQQITIAKSTGESISQIVNLANQISEYTNALTESFNQLLSLTQQL